MNEKTTYTPPNTSTDYRASAQECLDRAQRALEVAEINLDTVAELFNRNKSGITFADLIGHGEARTRLGRAWVKLADSKRAQSWGGPR
jgi:hypothetical protein